MLLRFFLKGLGDAGYRSHLWVFWRLQVELRLLAKALPCPANSSMLRICEMPGRPAAESERVQNFEGLGVFSALGLPKPYTPNPALLFMIEILHYLKAPKLRELGYIPSYG